VWSNDSARRRQCRGIRRRGSLHPVDCSVRPVCMVWGFRPHHGCTGRCPSPKVRSAIIGSILTLRGDVRDTTFPDFETVAKESLRSGIW